MGERLQTGDIPKLSTLVCWNHTGDRGWAVSSWILPREIAAQYAEVVYLGVGLHRGYGSAQRMYVKQGLSSDGTGVWYGDEVCEQNGVYCNDDSLALYLQEVEIGGSWIPLTAWCFSLDQFLSVCHNMW